MTQPTAGTTNFVSLDGYTTVVPTGQTSLTVDNYLGWNFTMQLGSASDGQNEMLIVETDGSSPIETVDALSDGVRQITALTVAPNNGTAFTLNSITVVLNGYDSTFSGGTLELVGLLNGSPVSGAYLDENVSDIDNSGSAVTFDVTGFSQFHGITSFKVIPQAGGNVTGLIGIGAINATGFTQPGPALTADSGSASFVAGDNVTSTPVAVDSGLTLSDSGAATLSAATVAITGNFTVGEDLLTFTNTSAATYGNISASYNATTGVMSLSSAGNTATLAQWQAALEAVKYTDTAITPSAAMRTITFSATDLNSSVATATRSVTVTDTDQTPVVTTSGGSDSAVAHGSAVTIDSGITVTDRDNATLASATVTLTSGAHAGDVLAFNNTNASIFGNVSGSLTGTVLTLTSSGATATVAQWQAALEAVTFSTTSSVSGSRTVSFVVNDGTENSTAATKSIGVVQGAQIVTDGGSAAFTAGDNVTSTPVVVDSGVTVTDAAASTLTSATVAITGNLHSSEDALAFSNTNAATYGNIAGSYASGTGVLTLSSSGGTATLAQWQAALDAVTYTDTAITPNNATRTVTFTVNDGVVSPASATRTVTVADVDQTPTVASSGGTDSAVQNGAATAVDGTVTVSDRDNTMLASGTVAISTGLHAGDALGFSNTSAATFGNVSGSYNSGTGVLTLTSSGSTATVAQWQAALRAVTFSTTSSATGTRVISFVVNDGTENSTAATKNLSVSTGPILTPDTGSAAFVAGDNTQAPPVAVDSGLTLTDASASTLASATVAITGNFHSSEDVLGFTNTNSTSFGNIAANYNAGTGVLTLSSSGATATVAQWQAALRAVTFSTTSAAGGNRTIAFAVNDGSQTSALASDTVDVVGSTVTGNVVSIGASALVTNGLTLPPGPVSVGSGATVALQSGGTLSAGTSPGNGHSGLTVGPGSGGTVTVAAGATLTANGSRLTVGDRGAGTLRITGGGAVLAGSSGYSDVESALAVGAESGGNGTLTIAGAGSSLVASGGAVIGGVDAGSGVTAGGTGTVSVTGGGALQTGALMIESGSSLVVDGSSTLSAPSLALDGGSVSLGRLSAALPVTFGDGGSLTVDALSGAAAVSGFGFGDTIDLTGLSEPAGLVTSLSASSGSLSIGTEGGVAAYASSDGHGGTLISATSTSVGVYRFFESSTGTHFFTTSTSEAAALQQPGAGYTYEGFDNGLAAVTAGNGDPAEVPVYRFFDTQNGSHFYTASVAERNALMATRPDMVYEPNSTFYEDATPQPGDIAVYRYFDAADGSHFYTDSAGEQAVIAATRPDLVSEGIAFYESPHALTGGAG